MDDTKIKQALEGNLIEELGLVSLPEDQKLRLIDSLTELVGARTMARVAEALSDTDGEQFAKMVETSAPEEGVAWLQARGIKFDEILIEEIGLLKQELRDRAQKIDGM